MKTDAQKIREIAETRGHKAEYESRDVQDESGYWTKKRRGWWMGTKFLGENAGDALITLDPENKFGL